MLTATPPIALATGGGQLGREELPPLDRRPADVVAIVRAEAATMRSGESAPTVEIVGTESVAEVDAVMETRMLVERFALDKVLARGPAPEIAEELDRAIAEQERRAAAGDADGFVAVDREFHTTFVNEASNPIITALYDSLRDRQRRMIIKSLLIDRRRIDSILVEHRALTEAIRAARREWWTRAFRRELDGVDVEAAAALVRERLAEGPARQAELVRLGRYPLLVIDEVGYIPFEPEAANLFFQLVSARYERASLIVTSNKPFGRWGEVFGDDVVAAAMIDRLVHHAEVVALKGDSYRLRNRDLGRVPAATTDDQ